MARRLSAAPSTLRAELGAWDGQGRPHHGGERSHDDGAGNDGCRVVCPTGRSAAGGSSVKDHPTPPNPGNAGYSKCMGIDYRIDAGYVVKLAPTAAQYADFPLLLRCALSLGANGTGPGVFKVTVPPELRDPLPALHNHKVIVPANRQERFGPPSDEPKPAAETVADMATRVGP